MMKQRKKHKTFWAKKKKEKENKTDNATRR